VLKDLKRSSNKAVSFGEKSAAPKAAISSSAFFSWRMLFTNQAFPKAPLFACACGCPSAPF